MEKLLIVDVSNLFFRSYYGSEPLITSYGMPVQALHGFVRGMNAIIRDHKPEYIALALEGYGPSFRKTIEPLYKANRSQLEDNLKKQLQLLPKLIDALGYKSYKSDGFEADDVIGTIAKKASLLSPDMAIFIVSSDKDFAQLVDNQINLLDLMKNKRIKSEDVLNRYGISPSQFVDYLAIVGDSSDNIKGVDGIGPKGASKLLKQYGTLENIYANIREIKGSTHKKLAESSAVSAKAKILAQIKTDVPLEFVLLDTVYKGPKIEELRKIFRELEFRELEATMLGSQVQLVNGIAIGVRS